MRIPAKVLHVDGSRGCGGPVWSPECIAKEAQRLASVILSGVVLCAKQSLAAQIRAGAPASSSIIRTRSLVVDAEVRPRREIGDQASALARALQTELERTPRTGEKSGMTATVRFSDSVQTGRTTMERFEVRLEVPIPPRVMRALERLGVA